MLLLQQIINGLMMGGIYVLVAVSFTLTIGVLNFLNFSIPGIFMLSAIMAWRALETGWHWGLAIPFGLLVAICASFVVERFTYRFMKNVDHEIPLVSSIGFLILFENLVLVAWGSDQQKFPSLIPDLNIRAGGLIIGIGQMLSLALALLLVIGISLLLKRTQLGRGIRALAENAETATLLGIEVHRIVPVLFVVTGLLTGISGILFAMNYQQVSAAMGDVVGLKGIAAMVIGGMGNIWGAIIGGLLIGLTEVLSIYFFGADKVDFYVYGLFLVLIILRPQGILGSSAATGVKL